MSKVKIQGNASGTGVVTLTAPNTNTDRTITLPDGDISLGVGIDDNATSTAITIDASENVGIGTATPSTALEVNGIASIDAIQSTAASTNITIKPGATGSQRGYVEIYPDDGNWYDQGGGIIFKGGKDSGASGTAYHPDAKIYLGDTSAGSASDGEDLVLVTGGTGPGSGSITLRTNGEDVSINNGNVSLANGNLSVASGHGIDFSAATPDGTGSTGSEVLDDYEEGTWTPTLGGTATYNIQDGKYTKIGNVVTISCAIRPIVMGTGNTKVISGLPFTTTTHSGGIQVGYYDTTASNLVDLTGSLTGTHITMQAKTVGTTLAGAVSFFSVNTRVYFTATYQV